MLYKKNFSVEKEFISNLVLHIITRIDQQIIGRFECIHVEFINFSIFSSYELFSRPNIYIKPWK